MWGDAAMQDTVRIVYANQGDWGGWGRHQSAMDYMTAVWGPGSPYDTIDGFTNPKQPISYYIHNVSGSFYLHAPMDGNGAPTATTVGSVGTLGVRTDGSGFLGQLKEQLSCSGAGLSYESSIYERQQDGENMAARYGIKFTSYETGIEIFNAGSVGAAWSNPGMKTIYYNLLAHARTLPHSDVMVQSGTVRGIYPTNELSRSYAAVRRLPLAALGIVDALAVLAGRDRPLQRQVNRTPRATLRPRCSRNPGPRLRRRRRARAFACRPGWLFRAGARRLDAPDLVWEIAARDLPGSRGHACFRVGTIGQGWSRGGGRLAAAGAPARPAERPRGRPCTSAATSRRSRAGRRRSTPTR